MIKLGSSVREMSTGLKGMLTGLQIFTNGSRWFRFQPRGLNAEDGQPCKSFWVTEDQLKGGEVIPEPDLPLSVLGTEVEDAASGFTGTAIALILHISGCVHVEVQPKGTHPKTGNRIDPSDFDIRRLEGKAIKQLSEPERAASEKEKPSPSFSDSCKPCR